MRFFEWLERANRPRTVLYVLVIALAVLGFLLYRDDLATALGPGGAAPEGDEAPDAVGSSTEVGGSGVTAPRVRPAARPPAQEQEAREQEAREQEARERKTESEYVARTGEIQEASVEAFLGSDEKLLRPDSLTVADVEDMEDNMAALRRYQGQVEDLEPPEKYRDQHELLAAAVADLRGAAEIAHRSITDPASATRSDYDAYDLLVDRGGANLRRSNGILRRDYETI